MELSFREWLQLNSSRVYLDAFAREAALALPDDALMLDAGAGRGPYRHHFSHVRYESADICQIEREYGEITYICDLADIPVEDNRYDLVLMTQVLEHVPEPRQVLQELHRVLKPGGELWLSAPLFYEEHEVPFDFYRYTQYGFTHLLKTVGFEVKRLDWLEGYLGTLSYQLRAAVRALPYWPDDYGGGVVGLAGAILGIALKPSFFLLSLLFGWLDVRHKHVNSGQCKNYKLVARKP